MTTEANANPTTDPTAAPAPVPAADPHANAAPTDPVRAKLLEHGINGDIANKIVEVLGAVTLEDLQGVNEDDLVGCGMKKLPARTLANKLKAEAAPPPAAVNTAAATAATNAVLATSILPAVPSDSSWLQSLRSGGILRVDESTVIAAVRATLAHRVGLYDIPDKLVDQMKAYAESLDEQVDPEYWKIRRLLTRRNYAEIFSAIEGLEGSAVTEGLKTQFFERIDEDMWPAIMTFNGQLKGWMENWLQGSMNPAAMIAAFMSMSGTLGGVGLPPGIMTPPDTGIIRDGAMTVNEAVNRVFRGFGGQVAAAVAYDATKIRESLENPRIPAMIGAPNRDQMLRMLEVSVPATYTRLEQSLVQYVLSIFRIKDLPAGNDEFQFYGALSMLGNQIPWDQLSTIGYRAPAPAPTHDPRGIGAAKNPRRFNREEL